MSVMLLIHSLQGIFYHQLYWYYSFLRVFFWFPHHMSKVMQFPSYQGSM